MPILVQFTRMAGCKPKIKAATVLSLSVFSMFKELTIIHGIAFQEAAEVSQKRVEAKELLADSSQNMAPRGQLPNESSETSESEEDNNRSTAELSTSDVPTTCPFKHEGKMLLCKSYQFNIDDLFTLLFSYGKFHMDLMEVMKYTDVTHSSWEENPSTGLKVRVSYLVVPVNQPVGSKTCQVTETQVMQSCSKPGELYVIDVDTVNAGVPYCDSFYINTHYCLTRVSGSEANFSVYSQIKYRKSVWGIVKGFIEKNVWASMEEYYKNLNKALIEEYNRKQSANGVDVAMIEERESSTENNSDPQSELLATTIVPTHSTFTSSTNDMVLQAILGVLLFLLIFNAVLYYKLSILENFDKGSNLISLIDNEILSEERSHEQWVSLLQKLAIQHDKEIQELKNTLKSVVSLIRKAEELMTNLQDSIQAVPSERIVAVLSPSSNSGDNVLLNKNTDL